jgi:cytochrome b subunit of formate dehydrogenase
MAQRTQVVNHVSGCLPSSARSIALLAISFIVLAWSGFALKYPGQWWARPVLLWEAVPLRSVIHRVAAVAFIAVAAIHVISLILNARLHRHWQALVPNKRDLIEAAGGFRYNLGLRKGDPGRSEHSYVEKVEYWAVVWGGAVMVLTGVLLWATDFILAWLPKTILDVATTIHLYEAILATLAVLIWHFYSVIFDPDVYPLDAALLTGFSTRPQRPGSEERETSQP